MMTLCVEHVLQGMRLSADAAVTDFNARGSGVRLAHWRICSPAGLETTFIAA
jgi:hypothetical protein